MVTSESASRETGSPHLAVLLDQPYQELTGSLLEGLEKAGFGDLRASHLPILQYLRPAGSRITELAELAHIAQPSVVYLVNFLVDHEYVERFPDPLDGRAVLVRRTERGLTADHVLHAVTEQVTARWSQCIGEAAVEQLLTSLERLADATRPVTAGAGRTRRRTGRVGPAG
jgi:DNA-binding MarR family transcriptional regulator